MSDQSRRHITGFGEIPPDLGHPRDPGRGALLANIVTAGVLMVIVGVLLTYALLGLSW